jgi:hypothetical protein
MAAYASYQRETSAGRHLSSPSRPRLTAVPSGPALAEPKPIDSMPVNQLVDLFAQRIATATADTQPTTSGSIVTRSASSRRHERSLPNRTDPAASCTSGGPILTYGVARVAGPGTSKACRRTSRRRGR